MDKFQYQCITKLLHDKLNQLSCCDCLQDTDLYEEIESFLSAQNNLFDKGAISALDELPPEDSSGLKQPSAAEDVPKNYDYFVSVGFPQKDKVFTKYEDKSATIPRMIGPIPKGHKIITKDKYKLGPIEYRALSTDEQYRYIMRGLNKVKDLLTPSGDNYHYFIEKCQSGDLHFHGRFESGLNMKDIKLLFHNVYGISLDRLKTFVNIKKYDKDKWRNYAEKMANKSYQTTDYPHIKNL